MKAYVLINTRAGKSLKIAESVRQIQSVQSADVCWGRPDIIALVDVRDEATLANIVLAKIQAVEGVESTDTHIVIPS